MGGQTIGELLVLLMSIAVVGGGLYWIIRMAVKHGTRAAQDQHHTLPTQIDGKHQVPPPFEQR